MNHFTEAAVTVASLIIAVAALSVIVSPKAKTSAVIQATASGFSNALATAISPVTGEQMNGGQGIISTYPSDTTGMPSFSSGLPSFG